MPRRVWLVPAVALVTGACQQATTPTEPSAASLSASEAQFLAGAFDASASGVLDGVFAAGGPAAAPARTVLSSITTVTFERTRACRTGGTLTLAGTLTKTWDREAGTYDVEGSGAKTREGCQFTKGDVVFTIDGVTDWTHERHYVHGAAAGIWLTTYQGDFDWTKSTGESGSCELDLTRTWDMDEKVRTLDGTFCDRDIHRTGSWGDSE